MSRNCIKMRSFIKNSLRTILFQYVYNFVNKVSYLYFRDQLCFQLFNSQLCHRSIVQNDACENKFANHQRANATTQTGPQRFLLGTTPGAIKRWRFDINAPQRPTSLRSETRYQQTMANNEIPIDCGPIRGIRGNRETDTSRGAPWLLPLSLSVSQPLW